MSHRFRPLSVALLLFGPIVAASLALAQSDAGAQAVLDTVAQRTAVLQDASFMLTGRLIDPDGTEYSLEVDIQTIPSEQVASAYIIQPDALADNIIVLDGATIANYTFLTHQITLFDASDPDAVGGLLGAGEDGRVDLTFDLNKTFAGFTASLEGRTDTPHGPASVVRLDNVEEGAVIAWVIAVVPDETSLPYRLEFHGEDDALLAELVFENQRTDIGLTADEVTYLPDDAEIIDERTSAATGGD